MADSIFGQKSGPVLAGPARPATTAMLMQSAPVQRIFYASPLLHAPISELYICYFSCLARVGGVA